MFAAVVAIATENAGEDKDRRIVALDLFVCPLIRLSKNTRRCLCSSHTCECYGGLPMKRFAFG